MIKRIFGWILFLWMDACLYGLFVDKSMDMNVAPDPNFWMKLGTGLFLGALAVIGMMMGLGISVRTGPPVEPPATQE